MTFYIINFSIDNNLLLINKINYNNYVTNYQNIQYYLDQQILLFFYIKYEYLLFIHYKCNHINFFKMISYDLCQYIFNFLFYKIFYCHNFNL